MVLDFVSCRVHFCKIHGNSGLLSDFVDKIFFLFQRFWDNKIKEGGQKA